MRLRDAALLPFDALAIASGAKSFRKNRLIGSPTLNRKGLHIRRVQLAERMADARRRRLTRLAAPEHRDAFAEQGFVLIEDFLPDSTLAALKEELRTTRFAARELKQGGTVTRFITLTPENLKQTPALRAAARDSRFQGLMRYVGASNADPLVTLHTVLTDPGQGRPDPQSTFHSDTFHATSKGWLFLRDVAPEDGPFSYVPGSHRMTPGRLEWEYDQSLGAAEHANLHHAGGSFRAAPAEIRAMGYPDPVPFPVRANTLVVADTHGFHARQPSTRSSMRLALYGSLRAGPFNPFAGPDLMDLPGLRGRKAQMLDAVRAVEARVLGRKENQPYVGDLLADDPAVR